MKNPRFLIAILTLCVLGTVKPGSAQIWWGPGGYDDGGWASAIALASSNAAYSNRMEIAAQDRQAAQQAANDRSMAVGSSIRNTMTTQAQNRADAIARQRQDYKDWWYQTEQQQMTGRPASSATGAAAPMAGGAGMRQPVVGGMTMEDLYPDVHLDIIKWPRVLQERSFATRRALIEAPYRRSPPKLSAPTIADYRNMVSTVNEMKSILEWRLGKYGGLPTVDYEQAKAFLNNLAFEAQQRADQGGNSSALERTPAHNTFLPENNEAFTF
jgi:hypothetical protein